ncbi:hypothetical protein Poli38472_012151 [Pythium oligandrum]|uniref:Uncharacterized protein n=1 Tax=Pythium oligandrum TaxID=41045 RepID=A0A8K1FKE8_PYTOL|nr:hypothetical protein Poli38472_012151 [Pythium oligandrum]|eukprot:TMW67035.1 hypothetical protein Poli38472_012151 [Pythium oligandrum]
MKLLLATALVAATASAQTIFYSFDPYLSAGVYGVVVVDYAEYNGTVANIFSSFDFSSWSSLNDSEALDLCSEDAAGLHYDPLKACGPYSEHADSEACKSKKYSCTPESYAKDPLSCEKGDFSGKFGNVVLDEDYYFDDEVTDENYPRFSENMPLWNIVLRASCGNTSPPLACAVGRQFIDSDYYDDSDVGSEANEQHKRRKHRKHHKH